VWEKLGKAATVAGILAPLIALMWYVFELETRIRKMEAQMQALAISPAISVSGGPPIANPILQACSDLARRAAAAIENGHEVSQAWPIQKMVNELGCSAKK
jgi:hypothetical protein